MINLKLGDIYENAIKIGMKNDPRGYDEVLERLEQNKKEFNELSDEKKEEAIQNGAQYYIEKPFEIKELKELVQRILH